jgi:hypothetical protein
MTDVTLTQNSTKPYLATIARPAVPEDTEEESAGSAEAYPASTLSLKFRLTDGVEISWTLRGDDGDVAKRLPRALATIRTLQGSGKLPAQAPVGQAALPPAKELHDCSWHGPMKESTKAPGTFFCSKKMSDGSYCKERWPKRAGEAE